ncbi:MAG: BlaI/MecI/CopY family transcriptional regulator [Hespellia sp.]|nr:BlaI/MecI/CopY family transcriptional regulator [Hespellia sp.]
MEKKYGLSPIEWEIMEFLWCSLKGCTFKSLMDYVNGKLNRNWKKQTLSTYLKNLQLRGLIEADNSQKNFIYHACISREQYVQKWTAKLIEEQYDNSIVKFVSAFCGAKSLDDNEADELRKLLD